MRKKPKKSPAKTSDDALKRTINGILNCAPLKKKIKESNGEERKNSIITFLDENTRKATLIANLHPSLPQIENLCADEIFNYAAEIIIDELKHLSIIR